MGFLCDGKKAREITKKKKCGTVMFTPLATEIAEESIWELKDPSPIEDDSSIIYMAGRIGSILFKETATETLKHRRGAKTVNTDATQDPSGN